MPSRTRQLLIVLLAALSTVAGGVRAPAEDDAYSPDLRRFEAAAAGTAPPAEGPRPGLIDRITSAAEGRVEIQGGYVFTYDRAPNAKVYEHALPDLLLRVGVTDRLELRVGWPGWVSTTDERAGARHTSGETLNPNIGVMFDLWPQEGWLPQTAVLATVPIGLKGDTFALQSLQPLNEVLYAWYPTDRLAVGGTTGFSLFNEYGDRFVQFQQTASLDYVLTDRLGTFLEWTMLVDCGSADDGTQHMLGGGFSFLLTERFEASWRAALGLNPRAPDFLTGVRCSWRY